MNSKNLENKINKKYRLGEILVNLGYMNEEELKKALRIQRRTKEYKPLGSICIDLGHITRVELSKLLRRYRKQIYIGELLVNMGLINGEQLESVLKKQKQSGKRIGELLIESKILTENQLVSSLSVQLGIPVIVPDPCIIDNDLVLRFNEPFLRRQMAIPAFEKENVVTLIMSDPLSDEVINDFKKYFNAGIEPAIATSSAINRLLDILYKNMDHSLNDKNVSGIEETIIDSKEDAVSIVNYIISTAIAKGASDIHIEMLLSTIRIRLRIDGVLQHMTDLPKHLAPSIISRIKIMSGMDITEHSRHQDGRIESKILKSGIDLWVSVYSSVYGENIAISLLARESKFIDIPELGFSPLYLEHFKKILNAPTGLILVCGPNRSGKTTTLYASLNYLNSMERKIITVEDPIEYVIEGVVQGQYYNNKSGSEYSECIASMMRQDPDVIMVSEVKDTIAAQSIINAALTGHKVFSTFHTEDTTGALLRLIDMGIETYLVCSAVASVIAQRLVRKICPHCREVYEPNPAIFVRYGFMNLDSSKYTFYRGKGCDLCHNTGFRGRTGIHEFLVFNDDIRNAILQKKAANYIRRIARKSAGMITLTEDGFYKAVNGITTLEEVLRVVFLGDYDIDASRDADEIIRQIDGATINCGKEEAIASLPSSCKAEKEESRLRLTIDTISQDDKCIHDFFKKYQVLTRECGQMIPDNLQSDFINFIKYNAHLYQRKYGLSFIEFFLKKIENSPKIFVQFQTYKEQESSLYDKEEKDAEPKLNEVLTYAQEKE
ncbi:MAG: GspE/PulE family protein [bacterium]